MLTIEDVNKLYNGSITIKPFTYKNSKMSVECECPLHGAFTRRIDRLMQGRGCSQCGLDKAAKSRRFSHADMRAVIDSKYEIVSIDGDKLTTAMVVLRCPTHGLRPAQRAQHLRYHPCAECGYEECGEYARLAELEVLSRFKKAHGERYSYAKTKYLHRNEKVVIGCAEHGDFMQSPENHWNGQGCPLCGVSGFKYNKPAQLYLYRLTTTRGDDYVGFGITNVPTTRHRQHKQTFREQQVKGVLLHTFQFPDGHSAHDCEQALKSIGNVNSGVDGFLTEALPIDCLPAAIRMCSHRLSNHE